MTEQMQMLLDTTHVMKDSKTIRHPKSRVDDAAASNSCCNMQFLCSGCRQWSRLLPDMPGGVVLSPGPGQSCPAATLSS